MNKTMLAEAYIKKNIYIDQNNKEKHDITYQS